MAHASGTLGDAGGQHSLLAIDRRIEVALRERSRLETWVRVAISSVLAPANRAGAAAARAAKRRRRGCARCARRALITAGYLSRRRPSCNGTCRYLITSWMVPVSTNIRDLSQAATKDRPDDSDTICPDAARRYLAAQAHRRCKARATRTQARRVMTLICSGPSSGRARAPALDRLPSASAGLAGGKIDGFGECRSYQPSCAGNFWSRQ
jgi:hypothetical protein